MPLSVVIGGQFGGEGKGAICAFLVVRDKVDILVKTGGPNSAHSYGKNEQLFRLRMVPCGSNFGPSTIVFPAGCLIHTDTLLSELDELGYEGQILVDPKAGIVEKTHIEMQRNDTFYSQAGSTITGTGAATAARARRRLRLAKDEPRLRGFLGDTAYFLEKALCSGRNVLAEGSQGFGLSNYHGDYPYSTSRDSTVGSFLGQMGLGPKYLTRIILAIKCFPTRNLVGSGVLPMEFDRDFIEAHQQLLKERGGGTYGIIGPQRRIARFDFELVRRAIIANTPDYIAVTGLDRLDALQTEGLIRDYYGSPAEFLCTLEKSYKLPVGLQAWGPYIENIVDKRSLRGL